MIELVQGRVVKLYNEWYEVALETGERIQCKPRGKLRLEEKPLPGDRVRCERLADGTGTIHEIMPRKNKLLRPQIANVDQVVIVVTWTHPTLNRSLLDRLLVLAESEHVVPMIALNKKDRLVDLDENEREQVLRLQQLYESIGYTFLLTSAKTGEGIPELLRALAGKVSVMAGPSGVGKTSLLNLILPGTDFSVGELSSKAALGRHTTRHVELTRIRDHGDDMSAKGGWIADSPGFSRLSLTGIEKERLSDCFPEMVPLARQCRFRSCLHDREPDCAVVSAVQSGTVHEQRYKHYLEFLAEIRLAEEKRY